MEQTQISTRTQPPSQHGYFSKRHAKSRTRKPVRFMILFIWNSRGSKSLLTESRLVVAWSLGWLMYLIKPNLLKKIKNFKKREIVGWCHVEGLGLFKVRWSKRPFWGGVFWSQPQERRDMLWLVVAPLWSGVQTGFLDISKHPWAALICFLGCSSSGKILQMLNL